MLRRPETPSSSSKLWVGGTQASHLGSPLRYATRKRELAVLILRKQMGHAAC